MESFRGGPNNARPHSERTLYCFADFTLDPLGGTIRRGENEIELRPKSFEVLAFIVERHGRVVVAGRMFSAIPVRVNWRLGTSFRYPQGKERPFDIRMTALTPVNHLPGALASALPYQGNPITVF